ncbi:hypothetical protein Dda_1278 [Drechslerella dactyloides]|uniref:Uncharacterized protein n=1 Tax=Drechslerella dactyloides TaxID=74499 RepID=A0AAD6J5Z1_DREDA|nr:hypothetical protein Dda_1278 [Drechslerella dactyloides]
MSDQNTSTTPQAPTVDATDLPAVDPTTIPPLSVEEMAELLRQRALERDPNIPPGGRIVYPPPPPTPEQRRVQKVKELKVLVKDWDTINGHTAADAALPPEYKKSCEKALKGWEDGEVTWEDGTAFLWGPNGLVAQGSYKEMNSLHMRYCMKGVRIYHMDECRYFHLGAQSSEMALIPPFH